MARFKMEFELDVHSHSPTAHRHFIGTMLDHVKLAVGRGVDTEGEITDPGGGAQAQAVIGSWKIEED
jgi:hypothetical protein